MRKKVKRFITFLLAFLLLLNTTTLSAMAEIQLTVPVDESILAKRPDLYEPSEEDLKNQIAMAASTGDYRSWAQGDSRWGSIRLGSSSYTVANSGCLVTSVTKLIIQAGLRNSSDFNVATFVNAMNSKGGFTSSGDMYWGTPANIVSGFTNYGDLLSYSTYSSSNYNSQIINWINAGYHLVLNVNSGGHWIAVDEAKTLATGQVYIMDSLSGSANADITLTSRYSTFNRVHAYKGGKLPSLEHTCNKGTYKWNWDAHPHYKCYQCSVCGEIKEFRDEPTQLNTCDQCRPGKPVLNVSVGSNGVATFTWDATSNTTHYNMWLLKKDSAGKYNCIKQFFEVESGFSYAIDSGEYCGQLLSYSSNMWEPDGSDWVHTWAMDKYFSYGKNKITFHADGGTLPTAVLSDTIDGINVGRAARALVAYDNDGAPHWTNKYGAEVAVNNQGRIVAIREYGDENQLTIPEGGFVLSGHADWDEEQQKHVGGVNFIEDIFRYYRADPQSVYVGLNFETGKVSVFDSYESYITNHKYLSNGETYGSMPVPERDGYVFDGWFTATSGGTEIKWDSTYIVSEVYAHWVEEKKAGPTAELWDEKNNKYYERYEYGMTWEEAEEFCESCGGHLITINDSAEQNLIVNSGILSNTRRGQYYIGITDRDEEGKWMLVTGQQATFTNWDQDVPECNGGRRENYAVMVAEDYAPYYTVGEWLDVPNDDINVFHSVCNTGFLCEYDLSSLTFDANGGVGGPTRQTIIVGKKMILPNEVPTRSGYQFKGWSTSATATAVKYQQGETFTAEGPMKLFAVWEKDKTSSIPFSDVSSDAWYASAVQFVNAEGIMSGSNGLFNPTGNITRAQVVATLYKLEGSPKVTDYRAIAEMVDVEAGQWYTNAVCWAYNVGVANGNSTTKMFNMSNPVTRQQLATFFYNYAKYKGLDTTTRGDISGMAGADQVASYAMDTVKWAVGTGLITGSETTVNGVTVKDLKPTGTATRAQVASIIMKFCQKNGL